MNLIDAHCDVHPVAVVELDGGQIASLLDAHYAVPYFCRTKILGIKSPNLN